MKENPIRDLLAQGNWGEDQALLQGLRQWQYAPVLWQAYETLQEEALFHSQVHGPGHIHRVLLLAALLCWKEGAPEEMSGRCSGRPAITMWEGPLTDMISTMGLGPPSVWRR